MFYNSSYFFFPAAAPINPIYPQHILDWGKRFGQANARAFDQFGWDYYSGEAFDLFYPGYGDSWPSLTGAVGMTYEQAGHSAAGIAIQQESGDTLTLHDRAQHHRTSGQATLRTAAAEKTRLLTDYAAGQRTAGAGEQDFLLVPGDDRTRIEALVAHLRQQGIQVERASAGFARPRHGVPGLAGGVAFPAGTYRVRARQPLGRLAITLLQPETELKAEYSYDVSAWSLPYAYGVAAYRAPAGRRAGVDAGAGAGGARRRTSPPRAPGVGYLVAPGDAASAPMVRFLEGGGRARVLGKAVHVRRADLAGGNVVHPRARQRHGAGAADARPGWAGWCAPWPAGWRRAASTWGARTWPGWSCRALAVISGEGVSPTSFGAHWYFLEQQLGMPFDALMASDLAQADLSEYDVIVLPDASPRAIRGADEALKTWVQGGGRLIAVAGGAEAVAGMAEVKVREGARGDSAANERARYLAGREERQRREWRQEVPGAILPLRLDPAHPLAFGAGMDGRPAETYALHAGTTVFEPAAGVETVAYFPERLHAHLRRHQPGERAAAGAGLVAGDQAAGRRQHRAVRRRPALPPVLALHAPAVRQRDPARAVISSEAPEKMGLTRSQRSERSSGLTD